MKRLALFVLSSLSLVSASSSGRAQSPADRFSWYDPDRVVTAERCGECHVYEYEKWQTTTHATSFKTMHRKPAAEAIAKAMGFKLMKRESLCVKCHYLGVIERGQLKAASGVSCESCHGPARDWIDVHNDYGDRADYRTESAEHKAHRIAQSRKDGMFRPSELYDVVANCFQCHTVPHERLVNVGGHTTGSTDFEFVERASRIQHNFLQAQFDADNIENQDRSPERKRVMFVVGRSVDLEYSLRGAALARDNGAYRRGMSQRVRRAINHVDAIDQRASIAEVREIRRMVNKVNLSSARNSTFLDLADKIGAATRRFIANSDGSRLVALDELLPAPPIAAEAGSVASASDVADPSATDASPLASTAGRKTPGHASSPNRAASTYKTTGAGCNCHGPQSSWMYGDTHALSLAPFINRSARNVEVAQRYGIDPAHMTEGSSRCMDCHATVISGQEHEDAYEGVGCESCHGPAEKYRDIHQRQGYPAGRSLGMVQLEDAGESAKVCARCHHITDAQLLAAGHKSGTDFDFAAALEKIRHWQGQSKAAPELQQAYEKTQ